MPKRVRRALNQWENDLIVWHRRTLHAWSRSWQSCIVASQLAYVCFCELRVNAMRRPTAVDWYQTFYQRVSHNYMYFVTVHVTVSFYGGGLGPQFLSIALLVVSRSVVGRNAAISTVACGISSNEGYRDNWRRTTCNWFSGRIWRLDCS